MAEHWKLWLGGTGMALAFVIWSEFTPASSGRWLDLVAGVFLGALIVVWLLGGHISAFRWQLGAFGEQNTADEIEKLGIEWHCEHDVVHQHGNWDHIIVGPPGTFVLDSKLLHGQVVAGDDELRAGRVRYSGLAARRAAYEVKRLLDEELGQSAGWVQAVVVVWSDFSQRVHEEERVVYVSGEHLVEWLSGLDRKITSPQIAARVTALRLLRARLAAQ